MMTMTDNYDMFWSIGDKLISSSPYPIRHVPIKAYLPSAARVVQKLIAPYTQSRTTPANPNASKEKTILIYTSRRADNNRRGYAPASTGPVHLGANGDYSQANSAWRGCADEYPAAGVDARGGVSGWVSACGGGDDVLKRPETLTWEVERAGQECERWDVRRWGVEF